jgi:uncharacterized membrane protein SpoIIM required for sporulation
MVLEKLYNAQYIKENKHIALVLGIAYAICGISFSVYLFPTDPAPMAIAFISLFSVVSLSDLLLFREKPKFTTLKGFLREHKDILLILSYLFMGILLTFAFFSIFMPSITTNQIFEDQAKLVTTLTAKNIFSYSDFNPMLLNNVKVLAICIICSILFGMGTIFLLIIIWNASVIGVVFGLAAKHSAATNQPPYIYFILILLAALPHIMLEILAYFLGGIVGDKISYLLSTKRISFDISRTIFTGITIFLITSFAILILAAIVETKITPFFIELFL